MAEITFYNKLKNLFINQLHCQYHQTRKIQDIIGFNTQETEFLKLVCIRCKGTQEVKDLLIDFPDEMIKIFKNEMLRLEQEEQGTVQEVIKNHNNLLNTNTEEFQKLLDQMEEIEILFQSIKVLVKNKINRVIEQGANISLKDIFQMLLQKFESCKSFQNFQKIFFEIASLNYTSSRDFQLSCQQLIGQPKVNMNEIEGEKKLIDRLRLFLSPFLEMASNNQPFNNVSFEESLIKSTQEANYFQKSKSYIESTCELEKISNKLVQEIQIFQNLNEKNGEMKIKITTQMDKLKERTRLSLRKLKKIANLATIIGKKFTRSN